MNTKDITATTVRNQAPADPATGWAPLAVLMCGTFLVVLDFFIVNVALPSMQRDLHASSSGLEWVVAGYGLTFSALLIAVTRLGDRWGRRRMFSMGVALFILASAACGAAPSTELLVGARLAQGVAGAMVSPMVLALIGDVYAGPRMPRAIGVYSTVMGLAAATGQLIGGVLIHLDLAGSGWRAIFWVNVPFGIAALVLAPRLLPDRRDAVATRPDVVELVLATTTLTAALLPLLEGRRLGWPLWTWLSLGLAVVTALLTVGRSRSLVRRGRRPLIAPEAFRSATVRVAIACQGLLFVGMASYFLVLALYLQNGRGLGALASGAVFTVVAVPYMAGTGSQRRLAARLGRATVPVGAATFALGHLVLLAAVAENGVGGSVAALVPGAGSVRLRDGDHPDRPDRRRHERGGPRLRRRGLRDAVHRAAGRERARCRARRDGVLRRPLRGLRPRARVESGRARSARPARSRCSAPASMPGSAAASRSLSRPDGLVRVGG